VDVNLKLASFIDRRVQEGKEALEREEGSVKWRRLGESRLRERNLMGDVRPGIANVPIHFAHDTNMLITV
jgi:hypothetical protein